MKPLHAGRTGRWIGSLLTAFCAIASLGSWAQPTSSAGSEAEQLRQELRSLKQEYEDRIRDLEERLQRLENASSLRANNNTAAAAETAPPAALSEVQAARAREFTEREFLDDTESRQMALQAEDHPYGRRVEQVLQDFVDIHGYFRAGYGRSDQGGSQVAFQAPGAFSKYRLGNEAENYGELTFGKNFYLPGVFNRHAAFPAEEAAFGPVARFQTTLSILNPYQDSLAFSGTDFGLPEAWGSIGNVVPGQPLLKFWAGSRYYRRHDIHISDFFFYNLSGTGGGLEDLELPFGRLALAWVGAGASSGISSLPEPDADNKAGFSKGSWDLRLYDVPLPLGRGEIGLTYAREDSGLDANGNGVSDSDGLAVTLLHTREGLFSADGVNKLSLQYGTGAAKTFTSGFEFFGTPTGVFIRPDAPDSWRLRATEHFTANLSEAFSIGPALVYLLSDYADQGGLVHWASGGLRPIWHFNKYLSLAVETGVDWVKDEGAGTEDCLYKVTLAPQVSLGRRFMSRPVIRGFVTYAHWGDDFSGKVGGLDYLNENEGLTYGVQVEAWW